MLETTWFALWGLLWAVYFALDGFDLGLGALMPFLARSETDRRTIVNAMGPFWDGNEVWLVTAGGVTFAAFPRTYAVMFSSLYTPLMLLLFALILRGIAFEFRGKEDGARWRATWDACLVVGSALPALLFGVAFANIFRGLPIDAEGVLVGNLLTLLNWYALLGGALFVLLFLQHGAIWLVLKSEGELQARGRRTAARLWPIVIACAAAFLVASWWATPLYANYLRWPLLWAIPVLSVAGLALVRVWLGRASLWRAWFASAVAILAATLWGVTGLYPNMLPSNLDPAWSVTAFNGASSPLTLTIMLVVALLTIPAVIAYQAWVYVAFRDRVPFEKLPSGESY